MSQTHLIPLDLEGGLRTRLDSGTLRAFGEHKGFGPAVVCEVLATATKLGRDRAALNVRQAWRPAELP
jgi:LDH2 family malate/lactate/ureidoglycolate dehydrogenase